MIATTEPVVIMTQAELNAMITRAADAAVQKAMSALPKSNGLRPQSVTQAEAARMLKKSRPTISKMVKAGTFKLNKLGHIPIDQIDAAISGH
ncbi:helix-turn-helix domain-containing protein [Dechloromonas sp. CZR5]|uniref:helix-turn-helix domain-containing protein n=1 Tax=Dechloromonas sp. CZR5 TaxID=2608630 RepID=UPI001CC56F65|nr:helix-turn-helix domain-containing protein [Dechloromonas sp. CZR5]